MNNINYIQGNLFASKTQTIVNTVNCVGVMGKGVALVFKMLYPDMFVKYQELCNQQLIRPGKLWLYKSPEPYQWVLSFPTKDHWKYPSKVEYIKDGLQKFVESYKDKGITSIAFPMLGTHNGGLDKQLVYNLMVDYLSRCDIDIEIFDYTPSAPDGIYKRFRQHWIEIPEYSIKAVTGIKTQEQINRINAALSIDGINSITDLMEKGGINAKTLEKCLRPVLDYRKETIPALFD